MHTIPLAGSGGKQTDTAGVAPWATEHFPSLGDAGGPRTRLSGGVVVEQIIRPTGLIDPIVEIRPVKGQVDNLLHQIRARARCSERVLVTTLTKRLSEDLTDYLQQAGVQVRYLHSDIDAIERIEILRGLRLGDFDALVG